MTNKCVNFRYIQKVRPYRDLTFKFYSDGKLVILDNVSEEVILPKDLKGDCREFYVHKRILFIKNKLVASQLMYA